MRVCIFYCLLFFYMWFGVLRKRVFGSGLLRNGFCFGGVCDFWSLNWWSGFIVNCGRIFFWCVWVGKIVVFCRWVWLDLIGGVVDRDEDERSYGGVESGIGGIFYCFKVCGVVVVSVGWRWDLSLWE